jgi:hypothetical protein
MRGIVGIFVLLLPTQLAAAQIEVTLPNGGSYRAGAMMAVNLRVSGDARPDEQLTLRADGGMPTLVHMNGRREATVPMLVLSSNLQRLKVIDADGRETVPALPPFVLASEEEPRAVVGPRSALAGEDAYAPTFAWRPGMDATRRRRIVEVGVLASIVALACTLVRGSRRAAGCLIGTCAVSVGAIVIWQRSSSDLAVASGAIVAVETRQDRWTYLATRAPRATKCSARLSANAIPVFVDAAQAQAVGAQLVCDAASGEVRLEFSLSAGEKLAVLDRLTTNAPAPRAQAGQDSPMLELARRLYVNRETTIVGTVKSEPDPTFPDAELWPGVLLGR